MMIVKVEPYKAMLDAIESRLAEMGQEKNMQSILKKSINSVARTGKEKLHAETKRYYTIKGKVFKRSDIVMKSTSQRHPGATLIVKGLRVGIRSGYASRKNDKRKGASAQILKTSAMKELKITYGGRSYKAFLATMKSEHTGIFQREPVKYMKKHQPVTGKNKGREAIKEITSLANAQAAGIAYMRSGLHGDLQEEFVYQMLKHMNAVIGGAK